MNSFNQDSKINSNVNKQQQLLVKLQLQTMLCLLSMYLVCFQGKPNPSPPPFSIYTNLSMIITSWSYFSNNLFIFKGGCVIYSYNILLQYLYEYTYDFFLMMKFKSQTIKKYHVAFFIIVAFF